MIDSYRRNRAVANGDCRVMYKKGDQVLLRRRTPGKMETRTHGPFIFEGYKNSARYVAVVKNATGKRMEVSSSNLVPVR